MVFYEVKDQDKGIIFMPSWNVHLEAGTKLAKKLKFTGAKRQEFLWGCLLPDINNGYINKVKRRKHHGETHYAYDQKSSLNFYAENRDKIRARDPIFLGYLFHLYTDGFFNYDFYRNFKHSRWADKGLTPDEKRDIKHHDFWLYDTNFHHEIKLKPEELQRIARRSNEVPTVEITPDEIEDVQRILKDDILNVALKGDKYKFYTQKKLDDLMSDMIESFTNDYLRGN